jgi:uncharacterized membrane protein
MRYAAALSVVVAAGLPPGATSPGTALAQAANKSAVSFKEDVLPIFQVHCAACHAAGGAGTAASGLDLTGYPGVMKGTKFGPMVIAGDPDSSNLMRLLDWKAGAQLRMPHDKQQLPVGERDTIRTWIRQGAKDN